MTTLVGALFQHLTLLLTFKHQGQGLPKSWTWLMTVLVAVAYTAQLGMQLLTNGPGEPISYLTSLISVAVLGFVFKSQVVAAALLVNTFSTVLAAIFVGFGAHKEAVMYILFIGDNLFMLSMMHRFERTEESRGSFFRTPSKMR